MDSQLCFINITGILLEIKWCLQLKVFFEKPGACNFNQFRPIGLCNVCYKVISKILVKRMRPLLNKIMGPAQVAFVPNRSITENVVLAQEIVHSFKLTRKRKGYLGVKLDFQKAYDRMEWSFLMKVLKALGFNEKFSNFIYQCISTVQYSLLLNGGVCQGFNPSRGLRQGDPLSPYLFILGSEILMRLINREINQKNISAIKVASTAPPISRLCYADDVIIFCKEKHSELVSLKKCLEKYCSWSGQLISIENLAFSHQEELVLIFYTK